MDILVPTKEQNWLLQDAFPYLKIYQNSFAVEAPPRTHWRSSQRSPDLLARLGGHFLADRGRGSTRKSRRIKGMLRKCRWRELIPKMVGWVCWVYHWNTLSPRHRWLATYVPIWSYTSDYIGCFVYISDVWNFVICVAFSCDRRGQRESGAHNQLAAAR